MRHLFLFLLVVSLVSTIPGSAQDEGPITKKARVVSKANTVYFSLGPSFRFAGNDSDYGSGFNVGAGFLKRLNRIVSIGPFVSYTTFAYDKTISNSFADPDARGNNIFIEEGGYQVKVVHMQGGDLKLSSVGADLRFDFIPSERVVKFSFYGIIRPSLVVAARSKITARGETWYLSEPNNHDPSSWDYSGPPDDDLSPEGWDAETGFTGGLSAGLGAAWSSPSGLSLFMQTVAGSTFAISHIRTNAYKNTLADGYYNPEYPLVKKGFQYMNVSVGISYTF